MIFFTSDTHFGHNNIIKYENRPFDNANEMDKVLVSNWNSVVKKSDEVYILGDFLFGDGEYANFICEKLNGRKYLILGNHDSFVNDKNFNIINFEWIKAYHKLSYNKDKFILFHYPIQTWDCRHHDAIHLYGHVHSNKNKAMEYNIPNSFNVGVDVNNFKPVSINEYLKMKVIGSQVVSND